ncbi:metacaspase-9 [Typha angustifolia]|uniref:metacaspase-9 n=1 Tax=Typha angustifolia TaxID=59011 RepID=UPI003C2C83DB
MEEGKKRLATMVGCNYAGTRYELHGCINDVEAMRRALVNRFGFRPEDVAVLTDAPGSSLLPTGVNVKRALADMIARAEPGDVLFFHYSGHGTLIPAVKPHHGRSARDEAIVPCDFNLITDVDFRELVDRLPAGASFTMISDSCHSGGLIDKEKEQIGPSTITANPDPHRRRARAIPFDSLMSHLTSLSTVDSPHVGDHLVHLFGADASSKFSKNIPAAGRCPISPGSKVGDAGILLSGCQTNETSADMSPGDSGIDGKSYGAFSNSIQMVLKEQEKEVIGNRELVMRAREVLREQGFMQHPCLYCSDVNANAPFLWQSQLPQSKSNM